MGDKHLVSQVAQMCLAASKSRLLGKQLWDVCSAGQQ